MQRIHSPDHLFESYVSTLRAGYCYSNGEIRTPATCCGSLRVAGSNPAKHPLDAARRELYEDTGLNGDAVHPNQPDRCA
jgi:hypothetical protein